MRSRVVRSDPLALDVRPVGVYDLPLVTDSHENLGAVPGCPVRNRTVPLQPGGEETVYQDRQFPADLNSRVDEIHDVIEDLPFPLRIFCFQGF